jgi:hypothetical protein
LASHLDSLLLFARASGQIDIAQDAPETAILAKDEAILYLQLATMAVGRSIVKYLWYAHIQDARK